MKHLIDKEKFWDELGLLEANKSEFTPERVYVKNISKALSKHLENIVDEPHHPSGKDRHDINVRNELRERMRNEDR